MDEEPPEQMNQSCGNTATLVFSFDTKEQQSDFIFELFSFYSEKAHFSLSIEKKNNCLIKLFCSDKESKRETENKIKEIAYNVMHHEKNKYWFWKRY